MHDVVRGAGGQIQLTLWPEDFIISPDPRGPGDMLVDGAAVAPGERERARAILTAREYDALRPRSAGYSVVASAVWLGCGERLDKPRRRRISLLHKKGYSWAR